MPAKQFAQPFQAACLLLRILIFNQIQQQTKLTRFAETGQTAERLAQLNASLARNPYRRLPTPEDVAACLVELSRPGTAWLNGNVIRVDGGEDCAG